MAEAEIIENVIKPSSLGPGQYRQRESLSRRASVRKPRSDSVGLRLVGARSGSVDACEGREGALASDQRRRSMGVAEEKDTTGAKNSPIWRAIQEIMRDVPEEVFATLPKDGAAQHDHYIYGLPKRP